jgi:DNA-binding XRE family transcriptional regulator
MALDRIQCGLRSSACERERRLPASCHPNPGASAISGHPNAAANPGTGWTQEQLAAATEITTTYTSDLERGTKVLPSLTITLRISRALKISVAELLRDFTVDAVRRMSLG